MGAKYLPTAKDLAAVKRYQEKQARRAREKQLPGTPRTKPGTKG